MFVKRSEIMVFRGCRSSISGVCMMCKIKSRGKVKFAFTQYLRQMVPKEKKDWKCLQQELGSSFSQTPVKLWGSLWICNFKGFLFFCSTVPLKHLERSLQKPPFVFSESREPLKEGTRGFKQGVYVQKHRSAIHFRCEKLRCPWRVCTPRSNSPSYPATHTWPRRLDTFS